MKRYFLFTFATFYPQGGWEDFRGSTDTIEDALRWAEVLCEERWHENFQVVDSTTGEIVERSEVV